MDKLRQLASRRADPAPHKANILRGLGSPQGDLAFTGHAAQHPSQSGFWGWSSAQKWEAAILQTGAFTDGPAVSHPLLLSIPVTQHLPRDTHRNSSHLGYAHGVHPSCPPHWLFVIQSLFNSWSPKDISCPTISAAKGCSPLFFPPVNPHGFEEGRAASWTRSPPGFRSLAHAAESESFLPVLVLWGPELPSCHHLSSSLFQS